MRIIGIAAYVSFAFFLQSVAFAGETGVQQLVKRCEAASKLVVLTCALFVHVGKNAGVWVH